MSSKGGRRKRSNTVVSEETDPKLEDSDNEVPEEVLEGDSDTDETNTTISTVSSFDDISDDDIDIEDVKEEEDEEEFSKNQIEDNKSTGTELDFSSSKLELMQEEETILDEDESKKVPDDERTYSGTITKYEFVNVLMQRTKQLVAGAPPLINAPKDADVTKELVALLEINAKKTPLIIRRWSPDNKKYEDWKLRELNFDSIRVYLDKHIPEKYRNKTY